MDYAGAVGKLDIAAVRDLGPRFVVQPKLDGIYAQIETDDAGRIACVRTRSGRSIRAEVIGARIASGRAIFCGELEAMTEEGRRAVRRRAWQQVHLFDAIQVGGCDLRA